MCVHEGTPTLVIFCHIHIPRLTNFPLKKNGTKTVFKHYVLVRLDSQKFVQPAYGPFQFHIQLYSFDDYPCSHNPLNQGQNCPPVFEASFPWLKHPGSWKRTEIWTGWNIQKDGVESKSGQMSFLSTSYLCIQSKYHIFLFGLLKRCVFSCANML